MITLFNPPGAAGRIRQIGQGSFPAEFWTFQDTVDAAAFGVAAFAANFIDATPFTAPHLPSRASGIAIGFAGGALVGLCTIGIYDTVSETDLYPNQLLFSVELSTNVGVGFTITACNVILTPGRIYWLGHAQNVAKQASSIVPANQVPVLGNTVLSPATPPYGWHIASAYAQLPAVFPAATAPVITVTYAAIGLRIAA